MNRKMFAIAVLMGLAAPVMAEDYSLPSPKLVLGNLTEAQSSQIVPVAMPASSASAGERHRNFTGILSVDTDFYPVPGKPSLTTGSVWVHVTVYDEDWNQNHRIASGQTGPVTISIVRNGSARVIYTAGGEAAAGRELGPMRRGAYGFQADVELRADMGIRAGDVLRAEYLDPADADGFPQLMRSESPFLMEDADMHLYFNPANAAAALGHPFALSLYDRALDRDSQAAETVDLHAIRFQADGIDTTLANPAFNAHPLLETSLNTAVFNSRPTLPVAIDGVPLYPGEKLTFSFTDVSPADAVVPNDKTHVLSFTAYAPNSGAKIELDRDSYGTGDMVNIKVIATDFNFSPDSYDTIGDATNNNGMITISAGGQKLASYALSEAGQGSNTGVFTGRIQLSPNATAGGEGPYLGVLKAVSGQTLTATFTYDRARQDGAGKEKYTASATAKIQ